MAASYPRVRVENKSFNFKDREKAFKVLLQTFNRECNKSGVLKEAKERMYFESPGRKRRRKEKEKSQKREKQAILDKIARGITVEGMTREKIARLLKAKNTEKDSR